jgi:hypothetical protein
MQDKKNIINKKVKKPVINRDEVVLGGEYIYHFKDGKDLFTGPKEEYAYPEFPWTFQVAANLAKHILDEGGSIQSIDIGGGCDEVSHTGAVAYLNSYGTLDAFVQNSMKDMKTAEREARMKYAGWFSGLDYSFIKVNSKIKDTEIRLEVDCLGFMIYVGIQLGKGADGFLYLESLVHAFGAKNYEKGVGADRIRWVPVLNVFQRSYQLDEEGMVFLTSCMDDNGIFTNYRLDIKRQKDERYELVPEKIQDLLKLLKAEMPDNYFPNLSVACVRYLSEHTVRELIALLEKFQFIEENGTCKSARQML